MNTIMAADKPASGPDSAELLNATKAAELLGISTSAFRWHVRGGKIKPAQVIRVGGWTMPLYRPADVVALGEQVRPGGLAGKGRPRKSDRK